MEGWTLKEIAVGLALVVGIISSSAYLNKGLKTWIAHQLEITLKPFKDDLETVKDNITRVDMESCKNYLARCLADYERGKEISESEKERFWENYEHYLQNGGNSYIKHKVDKLIKEGRL